jgi:phosphoglycolate phosphatase
MAMAVIFDMDGTLFQTNKILEMALEETFTNLRDKGLWKEETPIENYREIMGVPLKTVWEILLPHHSDEIRFMANDFFQDKLIENIKAGNGELYPNVQQVLMFLKENNYALFIASNGQKDYLTAITEHYELNNWITETFSIEQIHSQNKADLVREILQKYNLEKGAVIGDRLSDIDAAKSNGLVAIGCDFDFAQAREMKEADIVIEDLNELKAIISDLNSF